MKNLRNTYSAVAFFLSLAILLTISCSRDEDENLELATFPTTPEVYIDGFTGGLDYFPYADSKLNAFTVDTDTKYKGSSSMRFDVPNENDPEGSYAGAIFSIPNGRDLSGYDALTFWAKGSQAGAVNDIGFGQDFGENKYQVKIKGALQLSTNWRKYIIPIPDPSKLTQERGLFWYAEGPEDGKGYTFWVDELQYEKLGTVAQPRPQIAEGSDIVVESFEGVQTPITGLQETFNLGSGIDQTVVVAPSYFKFMSSDPGVATVSELGIITVVGAGSTTITASIDGVAASGSVTINSLGDFSFAPTPMQNPMDVISIFSDAYDNIPVDYYNGFWEFSTTLGANDLEINGDNLISYSNLNFVGIQFANTVSTIDASQMTHLHVDIFTSENIDPGDFVRIGLNDVGPDGTFGGGDDSGQELSFTAPQLVSGEWISLDIPLSDFTGLTSRNNLAQVVFVSDNTVSSLLVDNIYLYRGESGGGGGGPTEPDFAAPMPTQDAANVISLFSDVYSDVPVDTWRTDWSSATFEDVMVAGDPTKKYSALDFVGIETVSNTVDASNMTHLHLDLWSADFTFFGIKLVDFGADGAFDGGDDVEHQINIEGLNQGEWVSLDIPLSDFTGLTSRANIAQYILVGQPTGATTIYVDNFYFYGEGGGMGGATEPEQAAPVPAQDAANVVSLFSDVYNDVPVDTWRTDWSSATFEDVMVAGDPTKKYSELDFVGIETVTNTVDASNMTHLHLDLWSADFTFFGIKLVDFGADGAFDGGDDVEHQINIEGLPQGEWVSLDIPLSDFTGLTTTGNIAQYILVGQPTGANTIYVDNFYFYGEGGGMGGVTEPEQAAPMPTQDAANVVSLFSDVYNDVPVDTWRTDWSSATFEDVMVAGDPTKKYSALDFVGIETVTNTVDASNMTHVHLDLWSADFTFFGIKLVDFGADGGFGGGDDVEHQINIEGLNQGEWVSLDIPLSDFTGLTTTGNIAQYILVGQPTGATTLYVDNFYFYGDGSGSTNEPQQAAPVPTQDAANVVSLFSDVYSDVPVDTWRTDWSSTTFEDVMVAGDPTKKYSALDFAGIETVSNTVDASNMTHLHLDLWSADFTFFGIKLVDFGADGGFGGGDDVEHQINIEGLNQGEWVSLDIPLSDFTGLTTTGNIAQYILVGQPTGATTLYVDNFYFYGDGSGSTNEPQQAAPVPTQDAANVVSLFSDVYSDVPVDTWRTDWSSTTFEDVMVAGDPTKKYSALDFAGIETVSNTVDASNMTHLHLDLWSADFTFFGIKLVDFGADGGFGGGDDVEHQINIEGLNQGEWVSLDIPLSDFVGLTTTGNIAQYIIVGQPTGATTIYVDNFYFYGDGGGSPNEPNQSAPDPTIDAANVISLFSDVYTDVVVDTWRTDWSSATLEDVTIAGNATKKYSALDFVGIETVSNTIDATGMTNIHIDVWSADFTLFGIKLVDFGADGAFGGGDDTEHQVNFEAPGQSKWVSYHIPLSDFTGLTTTGHIGQYILVGQPTGTTTVYVDNVYFHN